MKPFSLFLLLLLTLNLAVAQHQDSSKNIQLQQLDYLFIDACKNFALENYATAESIFINCIKIDSTYHAAYYNLAKIKLIQNDYNSAHFYITKAVKYDKENIWYLLLLSNIYQETGNWTEAVNTYKLIIKLRPDDLDLYLNLSDIYINAKEFRSALKWNNNIIKKFGFIEQCYIQNAQIYNKINKPKQAVAIVKELIKFDQNNVRYYSLLAEIYLANYQTGNAIKTFYDILKIDSLNGYANISLYDFYYRSGDYKNSLVHLNNIFFSRDIDADTKVKLVLDYINSLPDQNNIIGEISGFIDILYKTHPDNYNVLVLLGNKYLYQKQYKEARDIFLQVLDKKKDNFSIWQQLISCDFSLSDYNSLYKHASDAIKLFPNQALLYLFKGIASSELKTYDEGINALQFGIQLVTKNDPVYTDFLIYLSELHYKSGNKNNAFVIYDSILSIQPDNITILNNYAYYLSLEKLKLDKAEEMSRKTILKEPENPTYLDTYGWIMYQQNKFDSAYIYLKKAVDIDSTENSTIIEHFADVLVKIGKIDEAIFFYNKALSKNPSNIDLINKINNLIKPDNE